MSDPIELLALYLHLAKAAWRRLRMSDRDRMLVIAGFISAKMGLGPISTHCRQLILKNNPGHMIRKWDSFELALGDHEFQHFLKQVQRRFPQEKAENMLAQLGIDRANERELYLDELEYAAAILEIDLNGPGNRADEGNS